MEILAYFIVGAILGGIILAQIKQGVDPEFVGLVIGISGATFLFWPLILPGIIAYKIAKRFAK